MKRSGKRPRPIGRCLGGSWAIKPDHHYAPKVLLVVISGLPIELWQWIISNIREYPDMVRLSMTCKSLQQIRVPFFTFIKPRPRLAETDIMNLNYPLSCMAAVPGSAGVWKQFTCCPEAPIFSNMCEEGINSEGLWFRNARKNNVSTSRIYCPVGMYYFSPGIEGMADWECMLALPDGNALYFWAECPCYGFDLDTGGGYMKTFCASCLRDERKELILDEERLKRGIWRQHMVPRGMKTKLIRYNEGIS